jgi:hypothetical protein
MMTVGRGCPNRRSRRSSPPGKGVRSTGASPYGVVWYKTRTTTGQSLPQTGCKDLRPSLMRSEHTEEITADYRTNDSQYDIEDDAFTSLVD